MDLAQAAARGADAIQLALAEHLEQVRGITRRVKERFEAQDWVGIREDTVARLGFYESSLRSTFERLRRDLDGHLADPAAWAALKLAYLQAILGRDDFELAQTYFNSLARRAFPHAGVDPAIDFAVDELPLPYRGFEMASARMYAVRRVDAGVVRRVLDDAGFRVPFRAIEEDARLVAARLERGFRDAFGGPGIEALDMLRPVFFRNKGAYLVGRARRGAAVVPVVLAVLHRAGGLEVDAALHTEDEASVVFSFARWYFHADVASPREVIGFLKSILPRKQIAELYASLGYKNHGKTELYRDLVRHIAGSDERFVRARGRRGLVMEVFTLPSYPFVFKLIKDAFPPSKNVTRREVMDRYRDVLRQDRVGRLVGFQEFEHLTFPHARFSAGLLDELLHAAPRTVSVQGGDVVVRHLYVERRVTPLDVYLEQALEEAAPAAAEAAVLDWGRCLRDLAAADLFPGDVLLKNFGVTRHGRVVFYDYDEIRPLTACTFRPFPKARNEEEELAAEPWFAVREGDVFPEELRTFLGLQGGLREVFLAAHGDLFELPFWQAMQERNRRGEIIDFFPYQESRRLRAANPGAAQESHGAGHSFSTRD